MELEMDIWSTKAQLLEDGEDLGDDIDGSPIPTMVDLQDAINYHDYDDVVELLDKLPTGTKAKLLNTLIKAKFTNETLLHTAARSNRPEIAKLLLDKGADPNIMNDKGLSALQMACRFQDFFNFYGTEDVTDLVKILIERGAAIDVTDVHQRTPLHSAAKCGHTGAVKILLQKNFDITAKNKHGNQAIHEAAENSHSGVIEVLIEAKSESVNWKGSGEQTPLHFLCSVAGNLLIIKFLLDKGADVNAKDKYNNTPLYCASGVQTNTEVVKLLLDHEAEVNPSEKNGPLHNACCHGCTEIVSLLLKRGAKINPNALKEVLTEGYKDIVKQLIDTPKWPLLLRQVYNMDSWSKEVTTPFREMIKKMPDVAVEILNKCTVANNKNLNAADYEVIFNYEFIEDTGYSEEIKEKDYEENKYGVTYKEIDDDMIFRESDYTTSWGPAKFKKKNHPLAIMVESKSLNLLTHPVVGSLLHSKWLKFGLPFYFLNLLLYLIFLIFLTVFALITENPASSSCSNETLVTRKTGADCGISNVRLYSIYVSAVIVILSALFRLVLEGIQFVSQWRQYILRDYANYMEVPLYLFSIIFVWVFHADCLCPLNWQWQVGVVAVFLGWIVLIYFISKLPFTGIYVLMFVKIFFTFLKMLVLSILLVLAFGLTFYLVFYQPDTLHSPFSSPQRSLLKTMTMTTGEFDFDSIFRQDPAGEKDDIEEIPFPPIAYIIWIFFVILMPILLTNMLVGLAVDDIKAVQNEAALEKLALQVNLVLAIENILSKLRIRSRYISGCKKVKPNEKYSEMSWHKKLLFKLRGNQKHGKLTSIVQALHPHEGENKKLRRKTDKLLQEIDNLKVENMKTREKFTQELAKIQEMIKHLIQINSPP